jgi:DNA-binding NtrC family response regulator
MVQLARPLVVVADDNPEILGLMEHHLRNWDCQIVYAPGPGPLVTLLAKRSPDLLLLDLRFGGLDGLDLLQQVTADYPEVAVVVLTGIGSTDSGFLAVKQGAYDYLPKPPDPNRLRVILGHVRERQGLQSRIRQLEELADAPPSRSPLWGDSPALRLVRELVASVAPTDATALIVGEAGTGKGLVARSLHDFGPRREKPFVALHAAALPPTAVDEALFGREDGPDGPRPGCCEAANEGTLFIDEVGELSLSVQSKLLRLLRERTFFRIGSPEARPIDVRVVATSGKDLVGRVRSGWFREDLYARLQVVRIAMPPLRERAEDVPLLAGRFLRRAALKYRKDIPGWSAAALEMLRRHSWPGNVRQLEELAERVALEWPGGEVGPEALPAEMRCHKGAVLRTIDQIERQAILEALHRASGNVREAARFLGLGQATVYRKIKRYGISLEDHNRSSRSAV